MYCTSTDLSSTSYFVSDTCVDYWSDSFFNYKTSIDTKADSLEGRTSHLCPDRREGTLTPLCLPCVRNRRTVSWEHNTCVKEGDQPGGCRGPPTALPHLILPPSQ